MTRARAGHGTVTNRVVCCPCAYCPSISPAHHRRVEHGTMFAYFIVFFYTLPFLAVRGQRRGALSGEAVAHEVFTHQLVQQRSGHSTGQSVVMHIKGLEEDVDRQRRGDGARQRVICDVEVRDALGIEGRNRPW